MIDVQDDAPDTGSVIGEDTSPPKEEPDTGTPPEEPDTGGPVEQADAELPPEEPDPLPDPAECGSMPTLPPEALGAWDSVMDPAQREFPCGATLSDGAGRGVSLRYYPPNVSVWVLGKDNYSGGVNFEASHFQPTSQVNGILGFSTPTGGGLPWMTYVDTSNDQLIHHPAEPAQVVMTAVDPTGGLRALLADGTLKAYSATGQVRWTVPVALSAPVKALGVDAQGHTLVLAAGNTRFGPSTAEGLWVDSAGQPGAPFLALAPAPGGTASYELMPQAKKGLFLAIRENGTQRWAAAFKPLRPAASVAPTWLALEAQHALLRLPGGKGYLRVSPGCNRQGQFITASGQTCGTFSIPATYGACGPLSVATDGTLFEALPPQDNAYHYPDGYELETVCRARWWPALIQ
ncbi:hypothetical protein [Corallococcus exercitus]|uniref:hypothetical protein n=1 Tax=Corallococcus exercitus TaxID=2316736 RepID=UPI0035D513B4